jgi:hypothetical protein
VTKKHKLSPRGQRRAAERAAVSLAKDRVRLAELEPGGAPERPLVVTSASVIDGRARDTLCAVCEAGLELEDHEVVAHASGSLRRARLVCKECHTPRTIWFRIVPPLPS